MQSSSRVVTIVKLALAKCPQEDYSTHSLTESSNLSSDIGNADNMATEQSSPSYLYPAIQSILMDSATTCVHTNEHFHTNETSCYTVSYNSECRNIVRLTKQKEHNYSLSPIDSNESDIDDSDGDPILPTLP